MSSRSQVRGLVLAGCTIAGLSTALCASAAVIDPSSIYFRGGNCQPPTGSGGTEPCQTNTSVTIDGSTVNVTKNYVRAEEPSGGHEPGGPIGGGGMESGGMHEGGSGEEGESSELFSRLPPINMFMTLDNSQQTNTYTFNETITNNTGVSWDGFLFDLRPPSGLAYFPNPQAPYPYSDVFPDADFSASEESSALVNLIWMGASLASGDTANFHFQVNFSDVTESTEPGSTEQLPQPEGTEPDSPEQYRINMQEFPLVSVPEPGTLGLLGAGLAGLAWLGMAGRKRRQL